MDIKAEIITNSGTVTCGSCGKKFRFNPAYSNEDGVAHWDDPARWIDKMHCCPGCYDKAHGGEGVFESEFEVK